MSRGRPMGLWRLEWLRLTRTHRLLAIVGVYLFFGLTGPLTARYASALVGRFAGQGIRVELPPPVPADGIAEFVSNTTQIGLLVVVLVAASALAFDARREMAVFLRTRVRRVADIILPAYALTAAAAVCGLALGSLGAWYETAILLGGPAPQRVVLGFAYMALFLAFAVAVVAAVASLARGVLATAGVSLAALAALAILGGVTPAGRWLPTHLADAMAGLVRDTAPGEYLPAAATAVALGGGLLLAAVTLAARREI